MIRIYHNPRCCKSREGLQILEASRRDFEVVAYLDHPPSTTEIKDLLKQLQLSPIDLVRKNEAIWKEQYKGKAMSDDDIVEAMADHPKLIERPIVMAGEQAVIGRPPERIEALLRNI